MIYASTRALFPFVVAVPVVVALNACAKTDSAKLTGPAALSVPAIAVSPVVSGSDAIAQPEGVGVPPHVRRAVARFIFDGNTLLSDDDLLRVVHADEVSSPDAIAEQAERDVMSIASFYADHGHPFAHVDLVRTREQGAFVDLWIRIDEGAPYRIRKVSVIDAKTTQPVTTPEARAVLAFANQPFHRGVLVHALGELSRAFADRGYAGIVVEPHTMFDTAARAVDIEARVETGPLVSIDRVDVKGHRTVPEPIIRGAIALRVGSLARQTELEAALDRVRALGFFSDVSASFTVSDATHWSYTFEVVEGRPQTSSSLFESAHAHRRAGDAIEARALLAKIARAYGVSRDAAHAKLEMADVDFELGSFEMAQYEYSSWAASHPNAPEAAHAWARAHAAAAAIAARRPPD